MIGRRRLLVWLSSASVAGLTPGVAFARAAKPLYKDARAPIAERVKDLLGRMTLEEKVAQTIALWATKAEIMDGLAFDPAKASTAYPNGIGQISRPSDKRGGPGIVNTEGGTGARWRTPAENIAFNNAAQHWALEETRLGIPVLFHEEALHGFMATEATSFPQAIALAGSFDTGLVRRVNAVIAREARARGVPYVLSPVVDIARDPRWGRIEETFGEDPYLCGEMGVAAVEGLQGVGKGERLAKDKVFATLKHMTGHGQPQSGTNVGPAQISQRELRENFFPPFREVVERTAIGAVMPSYNEIDGVPSHANHWLLQDVLRGEWGFDGVVASDYGAVEELDRIHHVAVDKADAARRALAAGVDCELPDGIAYRVLVDEVRAGRVSEAAIDTAVSRMLTLKFRAGLFENPYGDVTLAAQITGNAEARALALEAARKSICLLKNDGTLPLRAGAQKIAVIGPNAAPARLGGYSSVPKQKIGLLDGIKARLGTDVIHARGVAITTSENPTDNEVILADPAKNRAMIAEAVEAAKAADVIVLAVGDNELTSREGFAKNHLGDRTGVDLLGEQNALFEALHALGKPVVVVAIHGRPASWPTVAAKANAILDCWYVGQEGGTAMAEALFGDVNPGAKLPVTVIRDAGQIPFFYNHKPSARRGYLFDDAAPLFPFGHGLSYTRFTVGAPQLSATTIAPDGNVTVSVEVANTGALSGDEVVQLYIRHLDASVTQPVMALKGFERVTLAPGARKTVRFTLGPKAFRIWNVAMKEVVEAGRVEIMTGNSSAKVQSAILTIA
ncbi:MAG: glycoside hydrolase family 3 N-terminal domain-containing protein [Sphingomonas sp.]|jgi:beta-glucosidase|uniref:glycoside hydrolase family 3 N-terminal domain-containing protein n=1 Tax=Sphingomonas sp. TaxID=28214 RepID=UPI003564D45B